ncbi:hypothetical protein GCM10010193_18120 [Kitasatospora atroaurantiaca]|uniref:Phage protein D n=1 Tax=Kitasatospora atroaurantiaca TaxID=285545 RepID=A0A561F014_9ACTN|nr:hypothetical protein [Kitasatospora atroaurantiaca]TWE21205.1 hypothetical protein FB465_6372 [Kitasatospora atroaurantiaca]
MLSGSVHLTLLVGPAVPVPVPRFVLDALTGVTVHSTAEPGKQSAFELTFELEKGSLLPTVFLLVGGSLPPVLRVVITVTVGSMPEVLIDGVMTSTSLAPGANGTPSVLTVHGMDLTALMEKIDGTGTPFPALPVAARVLTVLAKYAAFGVIPAVVPSLVPDTPNPLERVPVQRGTDLAYLRRLASRSGYVFTHIPGPVPGASIAYWGPQAKIGLPQPALNVDLDVQTNVESLNFSYDAEAATLPVIFIHHPETKAIIPVPIPDVSPLNPPLGALQPIPHRIRYIRETAKLGIAEAVLLGMAKSSSAADVVTAQGSLDVQRYGQVLRPRALVGVRGAGTAFDGLYFVQSVDHQLKRGSFTQQFTLVRNGLVSTLPVVPV